MDTPAYVNYESKKRKLLETIQANGGSLSLKKSTSNLFRPRKRKKSIRLDVLEFNQVLSVDPIALTAEVEGMISYEDLVAETLKYGCLPAVVPELKTITVGGAISGCGIESSSHRFGLVHDTVQEMEVVLGDGTCVTCSKEQNRDLFYGLPNTFGTLGYAIKVKISLISAKPFVKLTRHFFSSSALFFQNLEKFCKEGKYTYVDGVIFSGEQQVITLGEFVDTAPYTSDYTYMKIYYKSLLEKKEDYLTAKDYIWRYDTDWFWKSNTFYLQNPVVRFLLGKWALHSRVYTKLMNFFHRHPWISSLGKSQESIIQDILIPSEEGEIFYQFLEKEIGIRPIWICPIKSGASRFDFVPLPLDKLYWDFGFWDSIPTQKQEGFYNRKIEKMTCDLRGFKSLYSSSYYKQEEFWSIFDKTRYTDLKAKYDPHKRLGDLYQKISPAN